MITNKEEEFEHATVTLAQVFYECCGYSQTIGENIIQYIYKWFNPNDFNVNNALYTFDQHNRDCRYECYCCGDCDGIEFPEDEPNIDDEHIKNILAIFTYHDLSDEEKREIIQQSLQELNEEMFGDS